MKKSLIGVMIMLAAACAQPPNVAGPSTSSTTTPVGTTVSSQPLEEVLTCDRIDVPYAPEDWYADTPIYVGNEAPFDEVRAFALGLDGFQDVWFDRAHHGWIGVGFIDADVVAHQAALEAEFPGVGVVAVEMPYTSEELEELASQIGSRLPDDMDTAGVYEVQGYVEIWVGLLTPERIASAVEAAGETSFCLSGRDPATTPLPGPQPEGGEGWAYLGEADTMTGTELPQVIAESGGLPAFWEALDITAPLPTVDFENQIVLVLVVGHSSSCPETRLDDVLVEGDLVYSVVVDLTDEMGCTADWVPRTYVVSVDRDRLPPPPFRISGNNQYGAQILVSGDLRVPGSVPAEGEMQPTSTEPLREPTPMPFSIEPGFPWTLTIDPACGADYLGEINGVHWHRADDGSGLPEEWKAAVVDGLLDLELLMTEGPEPTLTASAAGVDISYLPGPEAEMVCG